MRLLHQLSLNKKQILLTRHTRSGYIDIDMTSQSDEDYFYKHITRSSYDNLSEVVSKVM